MLTNMTKRLPLAMRGSFPTRSSHFSTRLLNTMLDKPVQQESFFVCPAPNIPRCNCTIDAHGNNIRQHVPLDGEAVRVTNSLRAKELFSYKGNACHCKQSEHCGAVRKSNLLTSILSNNKYYSGSRKYFHINHSGVATIESKENLTVIPRLGLKHSESSDHRSAGVSGTRQYCLLNNSETNYNYSSDRHKKDFARRMPNFNRTEKNYYGKTKLKKLRIFMLSTFRGEMPAQYIHRLIQNVYFQERSLAFISDNAFEKRLEFLTKILGYSPLELRGVSHLLTLPVTDLVCLHQLCHDIGLIAKISAILPRFNKMMELTDAEFQVKGIMESDTSVLERLVLSVGVSQVTDSEALLQDSDRYRHVPLKTVYHDVLVRHLAFKFAVSPALVEERLLKRHTPTYKPLHQYSHICMLIQDVLKLDFEQLCRSPELLDLIPADTELMLQKYQSIGGTPTVEAIVQLPALTRIDADLLHRWLSLLNHHGVTEFQLTAAVGRLLQEDRIEMTGLWLQFLPLHHQWQSIKTSQYLFDIFASPSVMQVLMAQTIKKYQNYDSTDDNNNIVPYSESGDIRNEKYNIDLDSGSDSEGSNEYSSSIPQNISSAEQTNVNNGSYRHKVKAGVVSSHVNTAENKLSSSNYNRNKVAENSNYEVVNAENRLFNDKSGINDACDNETDRNIRESVAHLDWPRTIIENGSDSLENGSKTPQNVSSSLEKRRNIENGSKTPQNVSSRFENGATAGVGNGSKEVGDVRHSSDENPEDVSLGIAGAAVGGGTEPGTSSSSQPPQWADWKLKGFRPRRIWTIKPMLLKHRPTEEAIEFLHEKLNISAGEVCCRIGHHVRQKRTLADIYQVLALLYQQGFSNQQIVHGLEIFDYTEEKVAAEMSRLKREYPNYESYWEQHPNVVSLLLYGVRKKTIHNT